MPRMSAPAESALHPLSVAPLVVLAVAVAIVLVIPIGGITP